MLNTPVKIIVHHSAFPGDEPQLVQINQWHQQRHFTLSSFRYFVGYHYLIEKSGKIVQCRADYDEGCHTIGENTRSIGICLAGDFDTETPASAQIESLGMLLIQLCHLYSISARDIFPHRHFTNKSCYGAHLDDQWAAIIFLNAEIERLQKMLASLSTK